MSLPYDLALLQEITETSGVPGYEDRVREVVRRELGPAVDRVRTDAMGNVVGTIEGGDTDVVVAAHMDEIGTDLLAELDRLIPRVHVCQD